MPTNYRYNEFEDRLMPVLVSAEAIKVPSSYPYHVSLLEFPMETLPSSILVRDTASTNTAIPDRDITANTAPGVATNSSAMLIGHNSAETGRGFIHFDISSLPSSPSKVLLRLYQAAAASALDVLGVYRLTSAFSEPGGLWAAQPTYDTTPLGALVGQTSPFTWIECDVTALYNAWKSGTNHGLMLKADETRNGGIIISTREGSNPPQLVVVASGATYTQVGQTVAPGTKEFAVSYSTARLNFHSSAAGLSLVVDYQALGSAIDVQDVAPGYTTAGTSSAYTITSQQGRLTLVSFLKVLIKLHTPCAAGATLNPDGWGAKNLQVKGVNVTSTQLGANIYLAIYDGTNFQVIGA